MTPLARIRSKHRTPPGLHVTKYFLCESSSKLLDSSKIGSPPGNLAMSMGSFCP
eukprot:CAMPEP_0184651230 /NCGR_PEP_ID=MMETSP0308-20130426/8810_1 /TAXON_ID=38269 /ORGANISM="Gloeochaete witrockiana, Strain SAG 46.84" /LENGTH=53 /DNA_ID=CAMNT_0027085291 /DNA_START=1375 /DNA_END=1533 /DNA_ORIENTATION=-